MKRLAIVVAPYHPPVERMIQTVLDEVERAIDFEVALIRRVAGAVEIPLQCNRLFSKSECDAIVTLGAIERGETLHGETIGHAVFGELIRISIKHDKPIGLGIIGPGATPEQIAQRAERVARDAVRALAVVDVTLNG